jgi:hypothetical protein
MAWNAENLTAWEHPGYTDQEYNDTMENIAESNAAKEVKHLDEECFYRTLITRYVVEHCMHKPSDGIYLEKWYDVCARIFKSMSWSHSEHLSPEMDDTIINAWC